jgi:hypothetical protein
VVLYKYNLFHTHISFGNMCQDVTLEMHFPVAACLPLEICEISNERFDETRNII